MSIIDLTFVSKKNTTAEKINKLMIQASKSSKLKNILTINNWICYADATGDYSYKKIYNNYVNNSLIKKYLENQINFRKENL